MMLGNTSAAMMTPMGSPDGSVGGSYNLVRVADAPIDDVDRRRARQGGPQPGNYPSAMAGDAYDRRPRCWVVVVLGGGGGGFFLINAHSDSLSRPSGV